MANYRGGGLFVRQAVHQDPRHDFVLYFFHASMIYMFGGGRPAAPELEKISLLIFLIRLLIKCARDFILFVLI